MKKGDTVKCIDAEPEHTGLIDGVTYEVVETFTGPPEGTPSPRTEMNETAGIAVAGLKGYFRADRFKLID